VVKTGKPLQWSMEEATSGIAQVFPSMRTDIVIDRRDRPQRLVIETKFTNVFGKGWYRELTLKTGYVYQLHAYLRSQEGRGDPCDVYADGLLLHPAIHGHGDESVRIQGHPMRMATVDLAAEQRQSGSVAGAGVSGLIPASFLATQAFGPPRSTVVSPPSSMLASLVGSLMVPGSMPFLFCGLLRWRVRDGARDFQGLPHPCAGVLVRCR
jgi:5-methylcytosine-specific restriction enzyme subunit McrC